MSSNIEIKKTTPHPWRWFVGLYALGLIGYSVIEIGLHYLNAVLVRF